MNFADHINNNSTLTTSWSNLFVHPDTEVEYFDPDALVEVTLTVSFADGNRVVMEGKCLFWEFDLEKHSNSHFESNQEVVEMLIKLELIDRLLGE